MSKGNVNGVSGISTSDATALASDLLVNKTAYVDNKKIVGTMPNNGTINKDLTQDMQTYQIPSGYWGVHTC